MSVVIKRMCGILGGIGKFSESDLTVCLEALRARGPDYQTLEYPYTNIAQGFTRLAINGLTAAGHQPICVGKWSVVCNGEIYNYKELAKDIPKGVSDCWVLGELLNNVQDPTQICRCLDGVFAFIAVNKDTGEVLVARDPYGVRPLFQAEGPEGLSWASELKGLPGRSTATYIHPFPPGTWRRFNACGELIEEMRYHTIPWIKNPFLTKDHMRQVLRQALEAAVQKRLMSDQPIGALLSGGLDSSLVAAIASRELRKRGQTLHTFSIGMPGSTDLQYAQKVAAHIGSNHHEILCTREEFLGAVEAVVGAIESYDITTVRASVGNWLVGKWIRNNTDIKVVLNGDGSDEVGGGYLYFYKAPTDSEFESESERLLEDIHMYDVLRSDRCISAHGLEPRTPFLDRQFVNVWRSLPTEVRRPGDRVEKYILREAFVGTDILPECVLWRKKEAFSDGVSSKEESWYITVSKAADKLGFNGDAYKWNPPRTAEGAWYRHLFETKYGSLSACCIPYMWMPRWISGITDPSARVIKDLYDEKN